MYPVLESAEEYMGRRAACLDESAEEPEALVEAMTQARTVMLMGLNAYLEGQLEREGDERTEERVPEGDGGSGRGCVEGRGWREPSTEGRASVAEGKEAEHEEAGEEEEMEEAGEEEEVEEAHVEAHAADRDAAAEPTAADDEGDSDDGASDLMARIEVQNEEKERENLASRRGAPELESQGVELFAASVFEAARAELEGFIVGVAGPGAGRATEGGGAVPQAEAEVLVMD